MARILLLLFTLTLSWTASSQVLSNDGKPIECGTKFSVIYDGFISGIKFNKAGDTNTYVVKLYDNAGKVLATGSVKNSTVGEVIVYFNTSVQVTAATYYMASFYSPGGNYYSNPTWFNGYLPRSALIRQGGYYLYGSGFPTNQFSKSWYYVDPIFYSPSIPRDTVRIRDTIVKINYVHDTTIKVIHDTTIRIIRDTLRIHDTLLYANACDTAWLYYGYPVDSNLIKQVEATNMYEVTLPGNEHIRFHREFAWIRERLVNGLWKRED
jgi:Domain of unknown function (DUF4082)